MVFFQLIRITLALIHLLNQKSVPQTSEQKGVAERVFQLGAGIKLDKSLYVLSAINEIFEDNTYKQNASKISEGFKNSSGAKGAADKIIEVCEEAQ